MNTQVQQVGHVSGRSMTLMAVIGLHVLVIAALMLSKFTPDLVDPGPTVIKWVTVPPEQIPPEPQPQLVDPDERLLVPDTAIPVPEPLVMPKEPESPVTAQVTDGRIAVDSGIVDVGDVAPSVAPPAVRAATALQFQATRPTDDYYPEASRLLDEQGATILRVCVDAGGRLTGAPAVQTSSGSKRLDQAAVRWARESLRFRPATENGVAVPACMGFRVDFTLH